MNERALGAGGLTVPAVGQGTMGIGGRFTRDDGDDAACVRRLQLGFDLGLRLVDTAPVYGAGHAEELVGRALGGRRDAIVVATKFSPEDSTREGVVRSAEASLRRLGTDRIDLLQMHWPSHRVPLEETLAGMTSLVEQGKVRQLGLGNCTAGQVRRAVALCPALAAVQQEYSLVERGVEEAILPFCAQRGLVLLAYSPLAQGAVAPGDERRTVLEGVATRHGMTVAQVVLAWLLHDPRVVAIPKAASERHLGENAAAAACRLDPADVARIAAAYAPRVRRVPTDEIDVAEAAERRVYTTLEQALENRFGLEPAPLELAAEMADGELLKPIKVRAVPGVDGRPYRLTEGRVRYWAWVIAHRGTLPIPAIVEDVNS